MLKRKLLNEKRFRRKRRTKVKLFGTAERPRLSIFRSNRYTSAQLINDEKGETMLGLSTRETIKDKKQAGLPAIATLKRKQAGNQMKQAEQLGELIARKAVEKDIKKAVFDRGSYKYHGRIKAVAEGARKGGLEL